MKIANIRKLIKIGDVHFGFRSNSIEWHQNIRSSIVNFVIPYLHHLKKTEENLDGIYVMFCGDIYDIQQATATIIADDVIDLIQEISEIFPTFTLVGNHDTPLHFNPKVNALKPFGLMPNFQVIDEPTQVTTINGEKLLLLSWNKSYDIIKKQIDDDDSDYLSTHLSIHGFYYEGVAVPENNHISIEDLAKYKKVWSAHIHTRQVIDNIEYIGSLHHLRTSEYKNVPGIKIVDFENNQEYFLENKVSPRHTKIDVVSLMNMKIDDANEYVKNKYVDVLCDPKLYYNINQDAVRNALVGYKSIEFNAVLKKSQKNKLTEDELKESDITFEDMKLGGSPISTMENFLEETQIINISKDKPVFLDERKRKRILQDMKEIYDECEYEEEIEF